MITRNGHNITDVVCSVQNRVVLSLLMILNYVSVDVAPTAAQCHFICNLWPTKTPISFSQGLLLSHGRSILYLCIWFFLPKCRGLHFSPLNKPDGSNEIGWNKNNSQIFGNSSSSFCNQQIINMIVLFHTADESAYMVQ